MGMMDRLKTLIKANANDAMAKMEDPEKVLNQLILDMKDQLIEAKKQVAVTIADEKRLKKQAEAHRQQAQEWEKRAMMAVRAGRDDLAKEALRRKGELDELTSQYSAQWEAQKAAADKLREALYQLNRKIEEADRKKRLLISRKRQAEAHQQMQQTMQSLHASSPLDRFAKLEERIEQMEAEVEAQQELQNDATSLEAKFATLNAGSAMDDELARLKASMGVSNNLSAFSFDELETPSKSQEQARVNHHQGAVKRR